MTGSREGIEVVNPVDAPPAVAAYLPAVREQNRATLDEILADEFTLTLRQPSVALTFQRSDAIEFLITAPASILDLRSVQNTILTVAQHGNMCVVEFRLKANILAGGVYDNIYVAWFGLAGGKIAYVRQHFDTAYAKDVLATAFARAVLD